MATISLKRDPRMHALRPVCVFCGYEMRGSCWPEEYEILVQEHYQECQEIVLGAVDEAGELTSELLTMLNNRVKDRTTCTWCGLQYNNPEDILEVRQHGYGCRQTRKMTFMDDAPEVESWSFPSRSPMIFRWDPLGTTQTVWVYPNAEWKHPIIGISARKGLTIGDVCTHQEAIEASKQYILKDEKAIEARNKFADHLPTIRKKYGSIERANRQAILTTFVDALVAMHGWSREQADLRLRVMAGEPLPTDEVELKKRLGDAVRELSASANSESASVNYTEESDNPEPKHEAGDNGVLGLF